MKDDEKKLELKNPTIYQTNENCQVFNGPISGCVFAMPGSTVSQSPLQQVSPTKDDDNGEVTEGELEHKEHNEEQGVALVEKLKPLFYNNEDDARRFLKEITGMKSNDITNLVNRWVEDKRISDYGNSRKGTLWGILNDAGLYTKTLQNWCRRVY